MALGSSGALSASARGSVTDILGSVLSSTPLISHPAFGTWLCRVSVMVDPVPRATSVPWVQDPSVWLRNRGFVWFWSSLNCCHCHTSPLQPGLG